MCFAHPSGESASFCLQVNVCGYFTVSIANDETVDGTISQISYMALSPLLLQTVLLHFLLNTLEILFAACD